MDLLTQLNSLPMFLIVGVVVLFICVLCVVFLVRSWRAGVAMGMDKAKLRRAITSSATFTLLPSVSILLGVIALSGSLGIPLPWIRLSVIGALHYEGNVADIAARAAGMSGGLGSEPLTAPVFLTIALVMTAGILAGCILCVFCLKAYMKKVRGAAQKQKSGKKGFGDYMFTAMFVGLVSAYIGSYLGEWTSAGNYMPLFVAAVSAAAMGLFEYLARKKGMTWLDNFSMAGSMLVGMAAAVALFAVV
ncbi:MAG TPA: DUF5058 family protein [Candidatus Fournierella merdipullorum]|uniref:DUF5058 family protein n=1 Tax=Candidatus Allofournierella merdipullorum TaxID=2838595 RepID=A0A9D2IYE2_9FIRM|nr:DUF5058 family protein [Candidatus Fournierella merdipullorum]